MMHYLTSLALMVGMVASAGLVVGCEDTLSSEETVRVRDDGSSVYKKDEVKQQPDGTIVREQEKTVNNP